MDTATVLLWKEKTRGKVLVFGVFAKISIDGRLYKAGILYVTPFKGYLSPPSNPPPLPVTIRAGDRRAEIGTWRPLTVEERAYNLLAREKKIAATVHHPATRYLWLPIEKGLMRIHPATGSMRINLYPSGMRKNMDML